MAKFKLHIKSLDNDIPLKEGITQIWGEIYVELNGSYFPSEGWYDIISSILDMWISSIIDFIRKKDRQCELYFMDGPYKICLNWASPQEVNISTFQDNKKEATDICYIYDFLESFIGGIDLFINLCNEEQIDLATGRVLPRIVTSAKKLKDIAETLKHKTADDS